MNWFMQFTYNKNEGRYKQGQYTFRMCLFTITVDPAVQDNLNMQKKKKEQKNPFTHKRAALKAKWKKKGR